MKRSKFTDNQIMDTLKRVDAGLALPEVCCELRSVRLLFAMQWMYKYNHQHPNMALGGNTPKQQLAMVAL